MGILRDFNHLSLHHARWRILRNNLENGIHAGLHDRCDIRRFARRAGLAPQLVRFRPGLGDQQAVMNEWWHQNLRPFRLAGPGSAVRRQPRVEALEHSFPRAHFRTSGLAGERLCRVVPHTSLLHMIGAGSDFWERESVLDLRLTQNAPAADSPLMEEWCLRLGSLPSAERHFSLAPRASITAGMVWFAREGDLGLDWEAPPSPDRAAAFRDLLGLVHLPYVGNTDRTWLFMLRFNGAAADKVGHYRPSALDAVDNARFQVPPRAPADPNWGRTAQLAAIADKNLCMNGAPERIANQITEGDLAGGPIEFALLGELKERHDGADAAFADRLLPRGNAP